MFPAPHVEVDDLSWHPVGPGPDPAVLLEAWLAVNGTPFRLLAFRVPLPYSAGWSRSAYWEDDKEFQGADLLWDVESFRDFVRRVDEAPDDLREPVTIEEAGTLQLDEDMLNLSAAWQVVSRGLRWSGQDWRPAIIGGQPYILVGYPVGGDAEGMRDLAVSPRDGRTWVGRPARQHHVNLRIHGATCGIACAEVRSLGGRVRPLEAAAAAWLAEVGAVLDALPGAGPRVPFRLGDRQVAGLIAPSDAEAWAFDVEEFMTQVAGGLGRARMRWALELPLGELGTMEAQLLEGLAQAVRRRTLGRIGQQVYFACRLSEAAAALGLATPPADTVELRSLFYARLGKVVVRGFGRSCDDAPLMVEGRVLDRIYIFPDSIYLSLAAPFVNLACAAREGDLLEVSREHVLIETDLGTPGEMPGWAASLPAIIDRPITQVLRELSDLGVGADG